MNRIAYGTSSRARKAKWTRQVVVLFLAVVVGILASVSVNF
jgi:hypothetical protein